MDREQARLCRDLEGLSYALFKVGDGRWLKPDRVTLPYKCQTVLNDALISKIGVNIRECGIKRRIKLDEKKLGNWQ